MGQIVGLKAKPKRCNLNALGNVPTPAAGEYILVSYDNSMTADGQGNFDRYIMGDGRTAATELELKYLDDSTRPYIVEEVNKAVADIQPIEITGDVTNAPDEEDLTSENQGGTDVLKFKDKAYNSALYSGLGRTYLRKNIVTLEGVGKNVLTQAMVNTANTIYRIQYDYDLNGETITLPANVTLQFDGGSLANGTIVGNHTKVSSENVCFKKSLEFSGSWDGIIYTKWLEFISADDEYSEVDGVVTRNTNPTDNTLVFKQLEAILNGSGGGKVVFEKGYYQTGIVDDTNFKTNVYFRKEWITMWLFSLNYVDIDLNGSTIKQLRLNTPTCTMFGFANCEYACIHDGTIIGRATNFDYPNYINHASQTSNNYEWGYGIAQTGGYLEIRDINISYFTGDNICVGSNSWRDPDTGIVTQYQSQGFLIHGSESSYCGRNGITVHSSYNGLMDDVSIHNIGSDVADTGQIGSDGIMGRNPRSGIDMEFEDGQGLVGKFIYNNLTIWNCNRRNFTCAANTSVHSLTFNNLRSIGRPMLFSNMTGEVNVNNSYIETSSDNFINRFVTYNETEILLTGGYNLLHGGIAFNRCYIHDNVTSGTKIFGDNYNEANPSANFNDCRLVLHDTIFAHHVCKNCDITFLDSGFIYANGLKLYNTIVRGTLAEDKSACFMFGNTNPNVSNDILFDNCTFIDLKGEGGTGSAGFYVHVGFTMQLNRCVLNNCTQVVKNAGIIKNNGCEFTDCHIQPMPATGGITNLYLENCKATNATILQGGKISVNHSSLEINGGSWPTFHNTSYIVRNSEIVDIGTSNPWTGGTGTLDAENSSFTFNKNYASANMHFKNCIIGGLITEAGFTGTKENCVFLTPLATSGTTAQRPSASVAGVGFKYFDTDLNSPVYSNGTEWVSTLYSGEDEVDHGTSDTTFALTPNVLHKWGEVAALTLTLAAGTSGKINEYMFQFTSGTTPTVLTVPNTVNWVSAPNIEANATYQASIVNNIGVIVGV